MDENTTSTTGAPEGDGADKETGRFGRSREFVSDKYRAASGAVKDGYSAVKEKVGEVDFAGMTDHVRTYVRSNPGKALLISIGVGFLVGLLLRRDEEE